MKSVYGMFIKLFCSLVAVFSLCSVNIAQEPSGEKRMSFTLPSAPWTLTIPADNFQKAREQFKPDGSGAYYHLVDEEQGLNLSMFIEPANECKDSKSCRDMVLKKGNRAWANAKNFVQSEIGNVSTFEFLLPSYQGMPIQQQNLYAQFVVDGFWVDMHLSKVLYQPEDHKLFERIIKSVKFEPKKSR